jgi:hypothetical protein
MEYKGKLYGKIFNKYFDTGYTAEDWDNLEKLVSELERRVEALSQHDVIKNEVAVCPECGCNKVQKMAGDNYSCMNAYCEWQTVL